MILTRRLPGLFYTHRCSVYSALVLSATFLYLLFRWNFLCSNLQARHHVGKMCDLYEKGWASGSLCSPLCVSKDVRSLTCHSFQGNKDAVFSAKWHNARLVFKSAATNVHSLHWYDNGVLKYPTENEFLATVKMIAKKRLNLTLHHNTVMRLAQLKHNYREESTIQRQKEMNNLWILLQDNEYLISAIYTDKDVFPQLLGTCGPYFAVEYMEPIPDVTSIVTFDDTLDNWGRRLKTAVLIMELLEDLENEFREPFYLCDIKTQHFGYIKGANKMKYIDLNNVYPKSVINYMMKSAPCTRDDDCEVLDCRASCSTETRLCGPVTNNNLQMVCEKIFVGWRLSNTVLVPGLLMSQHTPSELASVLRQCANPDGHLGKPRGVPNEELKKRLYNTLVEMEQSVNNDFYL